MRKVNKEKLGLLLFFLAVQIFISGCTKNVAQITEDGSAFLLESKAQIRNENDTNTVKIDIALLPQKALRMEITATLGVAVATVLMTPTEIRYALHSQKLFYVGPFHEKTLYPVFKKNIDPAILWRVVHNQSPASAQLKCTQDSQGRPLNCVDRDGSTVKWSYEEPPRRRIDIISNKFEMKWLITSQSLLNGSQNETFVLKKPEDYKEISVQ